MISVTDPKAMAAPLKAAKAKGIKIITVDGDLTDTSISISNVQSDSLAGGKLAGIAMAKAIGSTGTVLPIDNSTGFVPSKQRTDGFAQGVHSVSPNIKVLPVQYSANDPAKAASFVQQAAAAHPDLKGVFGAETNNTQGALTGVREAGKQSKIKVAGYDTSDPIVTALKAGQLLGVVVQNPRGEGVQGVDTAIAAMQGKSVSRNQAADALFVTQATVNTAKAKSYIYDVNCKIQ
jgi:ribose transport system substrate-binding protein